MCQRHADAHQQNDQEHHNDGRRFIVVTYFITSLFIIYILPAFAAFVVIVPIVGEVLFTKFLSPHTRHSQMLDTAGTLDAIC